MNFKEIEMVMGLQNTNSFIRPFRLDHLKIMTLRPLDQEIYPYMMQNDYCEKLSYSAIVCGHVICSFGLIMMHPGTAAAWLVCDADVEKHTMKFCKSVRYFWPFAAKQLNLQRIQVSVDTRYKIAIKWIELYKFKREGLMVKWFPAGNDAYLYARVFT